MNLFNYITQFRNNAPDQEVACSNHVEIKILNFSWNSFKIILLAVHESVTSRKSYIVQWLGSPRTSPKSPGCNACYGKNECSKKAEWWTILLKKCVKLTVKVQRIVKLHAMAENRTRVDCLEGSHANKTIDFTTDCFGIELLDFNPILHKLKVHSTGFPGSKL